MKKRKTKKILSVILTMCLMLGLMPGYAFAEEAADMQAEESAQAESFSVTEAAGYEEGAYAEWATVSGAHGYRAYVSNSATADFTLIDNELIRAYEDYWRVDAVGLAAGTYYIKVEAVTVDSTTKEVTVIAETITDALTVTNYDRSGFAFSEDSLYKTGSGAYNDDGTLRAGAQVIYVTADTARTCTATVGGNTVTGFQAILDAKLKAGTSNDILDFRIIGCVRRADLDKISSSSEGLQIKSNAGNYAEMNITIEGIGEDAAIKDFGILIRSCGNVELRNFAVLNFMDDGISVDTGNCNIWIHDLDLFYGAAGGDSDQAKGDGSVDIKGASTYVTVSYNHFWDSGKCSLCGMGDTSEFMVTYHHNWFDHSDSRHARVRAGTIHLYNNYYDGNAKYGVGAANASSIFVEANYFRNCYYPMIISTQASDALGGNIMSGEDGGIIKAYNNKIVGAANLVYANSDDGTSAANPTDFDAYLASSRSEQVPSDYKTLKGSTTYNNFDTSASYDLGVTADKIDDPEQVPTIVEQKAGRLNGGDLKWEFEDATEDANYAVITGLKSAVVNYTSKVIAIGGIEGAVSGGETGGETGGDNSGETGGAPIPAGGMVHNFTTDGTTSSYYTISGNMNNSSSLATTTYNGLTLTKALKMESSTAISFTASKEGTLTLVHGSSFTGGTKVDDTKYSATAGIVTVELEAGDHTITKGDTADLYYISYVSEDSGEENPPAAETYAITVTGGTASAANAQAGTVVTITANTVSGKEFEMWTVKSGAVTFANATSATTTFTMPASAVEIEAQFKDTGSTVDPAPADPELVDFELNVSDLTNGTFTESFEKNGFTILADAQNTVVVEANAKDYDGVSYTKRLKTGGTGTTEHRSIRFTTEAAATVTVVAVSSSGSESRTMAIATADKSGAFTQLGTASVSTSLCTSIFNLSEAGTYYLYSSITGGLNFYYIKVSYAASGDTPGDGSGDTSGDGSGERVDDEVREQAPEFKAGDLYVSTKGTATASGSFEDPMDFVTALENISAGNTIWMFSGTYYAYDMYGEPIIIAESNSGTADAYKTVSSINGRRVTVDFDGMEEESTNRGITLDGSYWHFYDIDICNAGDNGMLLSGDYNKIELCKFYGNHDTGLQLSRYNISYGTVDLWPSYNLILNCTAYDNKDLATSENADGFAAKLTCGEGNVFDGCISYCNSDDGWDLYAKSDTGPIGVVTIRNCVAFGNGKLSNGEGSAAGDMNGFKLGGSGIGTAHIVENCLSFNNGAAGFTDNNNPADITLTNCSAVNNGKYAAKANYVTYRSAAGAVYKNLLSSVSSTGAETDKFKGTVIHSLYHYKAASTNGSYYWVNSSNFDGTAIKYTGSEAADQTVTDADFVNLTVPGYSASTGVYSADYHEIFRNEDGSINVGGLFEVKKESKLYTAGEGGTYIGAKFSVDNEEVTYTVIVTNGTAIPARAAAGETVTITADTLANKEFEKWVVKAGAVTLANEASATTTFTMSASAVEIEAQYKDVTQPVEEIYKVTVVNGTATPAEAKEGTVITITADTIANKVFEKWVVKAGAVTLANATSATTTFTMPASAVEIEAQYKDVTQPAEETYKVTVVNGTATPAEAKEGTVITITADTVASKEFEKWVVKAGAVTLESATSATTTFTMPATAVEVEAVFKDAEEEVKSGLVLEGNKWVYYENGQVNTEKNGLVPYADEWFYVENGAVDLTESGFVDYDGGTFYVAKGRVVKEYSGLAQNGSNWYFVANGQLQTQYSGLALYDNAWFLLENGKVNNVYRGLFDYDGARFLVADGQIISSYNGLFQYQGSWYFISGGQVQTEYSGLALYDNAWFYISDGILDESYTGAVWYDGSQFQVVYGMVQP